MSRKSWSKSRHVFLCQFFLNNSYLKLTFLLFWDSSQIKQVENEVGTFESLNRYLRNNVKKYWSMSRHIFPCQFFHESWFLTLSRNRSWAWLGPAVETPMPKTNLISFPSLVKIKPKIVLINNTIIEVQVLCILSDLFF